VIVILYVDNNPVLLDSGKRFLEREKDIQVDTAVTAGEALERMKKVSYDAIISDYDLPETDGIRFLRIVREKSPRLPFIIFTGTSREQIVIEALNNGADYYIKKGDDPESQFAELSHSIRLLKRADSAQILARKNLTMFSGMTRHDILNQLMVVSGSLELAADGVQEPGLLQNLVRAQTSTRTIQQQIIFSREYENLGAEAPSWQPVPTVIHKAFLELNADAITLDLPDDTVFVFADPLFEKVFYHLFNYAHKYGKTVTHITVSYHRTDAGLIITVSDNGVGLSPQERMHLFDRRQGIEKIPSLFLAEKILEVTGITIRETGDAKKGSRFEIIIPLEGFRTGSTQIS
jgi:DNA-binding response OmpR family regulator